jgi:hypothetical protein
MISIDECKAVRADGYKVSQKGADGPLQVTLAKSFRQKQAYTDGMDWNGQDPITEFYAEGVMIDGEPHDVVLIARRRQAAAAKGC